MIRFPSCPRCGYDYRVQGGDALDLLVYLLAIMGLVSYFLVSVNYRTGMAGMDRRHDRFPNRREIARSATAGRVPIMKPAG